MAIKDYISAALGTGALTGGIPIKTGLLTNLFKKKTTTPTKNQNISQSSTTNMSYPSKTQNMSYANQSSLGVKTKSPTDNIKQTSNITTQPKTQTQPTISSTQNGMTGTTQPTNVNEPYTANTGLYGQLITGLANKSTVSPYTEATQKSISGLQGTAQNLGTSGKAYEDYQASINDLNQLKSDLATKLAAAGTTAGSAEFVTGKQRALQDMYGDLINAAQAKVTEKANALGYGIQGQAQQQAGYQQAGELATTGQEKLQSGLGTAAQYAQPQLGQYGQTYYSPVTGATLGAGTGMQLTGVVANDISNLANAVINGTMSYDTAISQLSGYGTAVQNQLLPAIQQTQPNFSVAQSNVLASQQGQIVPAYNFAKKVLDNLQLTVGNLGAFQGTNIPILNMIGNFFKTQVARDDATRQYIQAIKEARNAYQNLLAAANNSTNPLEFTGQATAAIPDDATPSDIQAAINSVETLGKAKVGVYGTPGSSNISTSGGTTGGEITWDNL